MTAKILVLASIVITNLAQAKICSGIDGKDNQYKITVNASKTAVRLDRYFPNDGAPFRMNQIFKCFPSQDSRLACKGPHVLNPHLVLDLMIDTRTALISFDVDETLKGQMVMVPGRINLNCHN